MRQIALGGAVGTGLRLLFLGGATVSIDPVASSFSGRLLALNVAGAAALGWVSVRRPVPAAWMPALTAGLLGGLTTFSTMIVQAGTLGHDAGLVVEGSGRMTGAGLGLVAGYLTASITLGLAGLVLGRRLASGGLSSPGRTVTS